MVYSAAAFCVFVCFVSDILEHKCQFWCINHDNSAIIERYYDELIGLWLLFY